MKKYLVIVEMVKKKSKSDFAGGFNHMMNTGIINPDNAQQVINQMTQASNLPRHEIFKHVKARKSDIEKARVAQIMGNLG